MKRILLVAATTGYQTRMFADAARRLEFDLVLATDRCHVLEDPWGDQAVPVRFDDPYSAVEAIGQAGPFDGILAVADRPAFVAAIVAEKLGLPYNSPAAVEAARNKFLARQRFQAAGLPVPEFFRVPLDANAIEAAASAPYPCVLKPLGLSASRGVIRADNPAEFIEAFRRIEKLLTRPEIEQMRDDQNRYIQIESFIPGREYAVEGVLTAGRFKVLAVFEKPDPLDGPFFEETIYLTPPRTLTPTAAVESAIRALGLTHGPIHAELRGGHVLEVAARPIGGLCAKSLRFDVGRTSRSAAGPPAGLFERDEVFESPARDRPGGRSRTGRSAPLEEVLLRHAAGEDVSRFEREALASGVMMIPIERDGLYEGVEGVDSALETRGVEEIEITAKVGQTMERLPEGSSYLGFIFARGETPEAVEQSLRGAHAQLHFQINAKLPVMR
jgi:hypothetical protein